MAQDSAIRMHEPTRNQISRAFRPLVLWLLISLFLLAWDFHSKNAPRTTLKFNVRVEGKPINASGYTAVIGSRRVGPRLVAPLGSGTLRVTVPDAEPHKRDLFIWYGENTTDDIDLRWKRGVLALNVEPAAKTVKLTGPHYTNLISNSEGITNSVPVGTYEVIATFKHVVENVEIPVQVDRTNRLSIRPALGAVEISANRENSTYQLSFQGNSRLSQNGDVPALLSELPAGPYRVRVTRDGYVQESVVDLKKWVTNQVNFDFEYRTVKINSDPDGASIFIGSKEVGTTPATLSDLKIGSYRFRLQKDGYYSANLNVTITGTNVITIGTNLVNRGYTEAIRAAERQAGNQNYREALRMLDAALAAQPGDAAATRLKAEVQVRQHVQAATTFFRSRDFLKALPEIESALKIDPDNPGALKLKEEIASTTGVSPSILERHLMAEESFTKKVSGFQHANLFETDTWRVKASFAAVFAALMRAIDKPGEKWELMGSEQVDDRHAILRLGSKGLLTSTRSAFVQV